MEKSQLKLVTTNEFQAHHPGGQAHQVRSTEKGIRPGPVTANLVMAMMRIVHQSNNETPIH